MNPHKFYLLKDDKPVGPYTSDEITRLYHDKILSPRASVAPEGATEWQTAEHWVSQFAAGGAVANNEEDPFIEASKPAKDPHGCAGCLMIIAVILSLMGSYLLIHSFTGYSAKKFEKYEVSPRTDYTPNKGMPFLKREPVWSQQSASSQDRALVGLFGFVLVCTGISIFVFLHREFRKMQQVSTKE